MTTQIKFVGIDSWNRPIFKDINNKAYFGSTDVLLDYNATEKEVLNVISEKDLTYFGNSFDCEPMGADAGEIEIIKTKK